LWFDKISTVKPLTRTLSLEGTKLETMSVKEIKIISPVPEGSYSWILNDGRKEGVKSVTLDVTLHPAKLIPGKFNHTLSIVTDVEPFGTVDVRLTGQVTGPISCEPKRILFGNYILGQEFTESVEITVANNKKFEILSIEPMDSELSVVQNSEGSARAHQFTVSFKPETNRDRLAAKVLIRTNLKRQSDMYLDVNGFKKREQKRITPRAVY